jgi:small redox-active disulfide protein 2
MKLIQVLGPGCPQCSQLYHNVQDAVQELGVEAKVEKVTDILAILDFGVVRTPAMVIDGQVKRIGQVPSIAEIKMLLA